MAPKIPFPFTVSVGPSSADAGDFELTSFDSIRVTTNLLAGDTVTFTVRGASVEAGSISELATDVWIEGPYEQRMRVLGVDQEWGENGEDVVTVQAACYKRMLTNRHVWSEQGLPFGGVDQGAILWQLYNHTQTQTGGAWGVVPGSIFTGVVRDRTYEVGDNLGDLAQQLQQVINGPLWWIDADLQLQAILVDDVVTSAMPLVRGVNARRMRRGATAALFANVVRGEGSPDATTPVVRESPDLASDPRGRWERLVSWSTVERQQTLIEHTEGELAKAMSPLASWNVVLEPARWLSDSHYGLGAMVVLVVPPTEVAPITTGAREVVGRLADLQLSWDASGAMDVSAAFVETDREVPA